MRALLLVVAHAHGLRQPGWVPRRRRVGLRLDINHIIRGNTAAGCPRDRGAAAKLRTCTHWAGRARGGRAPRGYLNEVARDFYIIIEDLFWSTRRAVMVHAYVDYGFLAHKHLFYTSLFHLHGIF